MSDCIKFMADTMSIIEKSKIFWINRNFKLDKFMDKVMEIKHIKELEDISKGLAEIQSEVHALERELMIFEIKLAQTKRMIDDINEKDGINNE